MVVSTLPRRRRRATLILLSLLCSPATLSAQQASPDQKTTDAALRVAVAGSAPFVELDRAARVDGLSVAVFRAAAARAGLRYELSPEASVQRTLEGVASGDFDVAVGPLSITAERARYVRFTQPYFQSSLSILAEPRRRRLWEQAAPLLSRTFATGVGVLLLVLAAVGSLLWLCERKSNPDQFPREPVRGIGNGIWLALVTMTTVGYGDRAPKTLAGRIVAGVWMIAAVLTATSLMAGIASALTLIQLRTPGIARADELRGLRAAVIPGTTGAAFALRHGARAVERATVEQVVEALRTGNADAAVADRPALQHFLATHSDLDLALGEQSYEPQGYGFAVRSPIIQQRLNVALLELSEEGLLAHLTQRWLGPP